MSRSTGPGRGWADECELQLFVERHGVRDEFVFPLPIVCIQGDDEIVGKLATVAHHPSSTGGSGRERLSFSAQRIGSLVLWELV
jgi:hypothetical protein